MAHEGNEQFKQQLATGKPHRNFDSITTFWVKGCFMRTMRLPLDQIEQGNKPWIFLVFTLKRLVKLGFCVYHRMYIYPEKSVKFGFCFSSQFVFQALQCI